MQKRQINNMSIYYDKLSVFYKQLIPLLIVFVNYFRAVQNQYMLFWLLKGTL